VFAGSTSTSRTGLLPSISKLAPSVLHLGTTGMTRQERPYSSLGTIQLSIYSLNSIVSLIGYNSDVCAVADESYSGRDIQARVGSLGTHDAFFFWLPKIRSARIAVISTARPWTITKRQIFAPYWRRGIFMTDQRGSKATSQKRKSLS
jgi:hypothetical protein